MNKIEIEIPEGQEIDWKESAKQKKIVFKRMPLTYEDVCEELFKDGHYFIDDLSKIYKNSFVAYDSNAATTRHQLECILAKNKLANVAVYLNNGWKPNLEQPCGYCLVLDRYNDLISDSCAVICAYSLGKIMFKSKELAQPAIDILGEDTIKLAIEPLY